jgi:hypothetical protein
MPLEEQLANWQLALSQATAALISTLEGLLAGLIAIG